jgi:hypothetical protein
LPKRSPTKFSLQFLNIPSSFYEFWKFKLFSMNFLKSKAIKKDRTMPGLKPSPRPQSTGRGGLPCTVARQPRGPRPCGLVQWGKRPVALCRGARTGRARGVVTVHNPHMGRRGGALVGDKVLPASTSGTPRWRWARRRGHGRIRKGGVDNKATRAASGGGVQRRQDSFGRCR